jgi:hypothetical protein
MVQGVFWDNKRRTLEIISVKETGQVLSFSERFSGIFFSI